MLDAWKRYTPNVSASLTEAAEKDKPDDEEQRQEAEPPQSALFDATAADCCSSQSATATKVKQVSPNKDAPCCTVAVEMGDTREEESVEGEL